MFRRAEYLKKRCGALEQLFTVAGAAIGRRHRFRVMRRRDIIPDFLWWSGELLTYVQKRAVRGAALKVKGNHRNS